MGGRDRCLVQPVGADWTDNRNVVGYFNPLVKQYESTSILNFILEAQEEPGCPYFLVLDEMNLSHVEYYFADFLSAMESDRKIPLHERPAPVYPSGMEDNSDAEDDIQQIDQSLSVPPNLFVIGTVNVDETTKMFSPKVLDRANVIEFEITGSDFSAFINGIGKEDGSTSELGDIEPSDREGEKFLNLSYAARSIDANGSSASLPPLPEEKGSSFRDALKSVFGIMERENAQFGYRTGAEALRYARVDHCLSEGDWDWQASFDDQMVQKVLPKLHGGKDELLDLLVALGSFFATGTSDEAEEMLAEDSDTLPHRDWEETDEPVFEKSTNKTTELLEQFDRNRFASFL
jgi:5-methylcytosine-specific restriction protein B